MQLKDATLLAVDDEPQYREIIIGWFAREGSRVLVLVSRIFSFANRVRSGNSGPAPNPRS